MDWLVILLDTKSLQLWIERRQKQQLLINLNIKNQNQSLNQKNGLQKVLFAPKMLTEAAKYIFEPALKKYLKFDENLFFSINNWKYLFYLNLCKRTKWKKPVSILGVLNLNVKQKPVLISRLKLSKENHSFLLSILSLTWNLCGRIINACFILEIQKQHDVHRSQNTLGVPLKFEIWHWFT